jgi:hypothetical protein
MSWKKTKQKSKTKKTKQNKNQKQKKQNKTKKKGKENGGDLWQVPKTDQISSPGLGNIFQLPSLLLRFPIILFI